MFSLYSIALFNPMLSELLKQVYIFGRLRAENENLDQLNDVKHLQNIRVAYLHIE